MHILNQIEKLKKEFDSVWQPCETCEGKLLTPPCSCIVEKRKTVRKINSGLVGDLLFLEEGDMIKSPIYKKLGNLIKRPKSFVDFGLGIFLYGDINVGKTKTLSYFFSNCVLEDFNYTGLFLNFTELIELLRRRKMDNKLAIEIDKLLSRKIIFIDGFHDNIDDRMYPDLLQILEQIFLRQESSLLITSDNIYEKEQLKYPKPLIEFLFYSQKIKPVCIKSKREKSQNWDGRIFKSGGKHGRI
jgi:hypothetical protein